MNWEQNNWAQFLLMAEFAYNNSKNLNMGHTSFELNCSYHPHVPFKEEYKARSRSSSAKGLAIKLRELMSVCHQNLLHAQDFQMQVHIKRVKLEATYRLKKSGSIASILRQKRTKNLKPSFLGHSKCSTQLKSKHTS